MLYEKENCFIIQHSLNNITFSLKKLNKAQLFVPSFFIKSMWFRFDIIEWAFLYYALHL